MDPKVLLVNQLLSEVSTENNKALKDWFECFPGSTDQQRLQAIREIQKWFEEVQNSSLKERENPKHPERNFLLKLIGGEPHGYRNANGVCERRFELFSTFVVVMKRSTNEFWRAFIATTSTVLENIDFKVRVVVHKSPSCKPARINQATSFIDSRYDRCEWLHMAAKLQQVETVKKLVEAPASITINKHGCTPIHYAAMAIKPNAEIARLLVHRLNEEGDKRYFNRIINQRSAHKRCEAPPHEGDFNSRINPQSTHNLQPTTRVTALHIAAGNVNVTQAFIDALKSADPRLRDDTGDTPFHAAAKSSNPEAIIYLLNTFAPTNAGWDVDDVDQDVDPKSKSTLINLCAISGNAKAVGLLIKHGADISKGVLHEIVLESVTRPDKIDKLVNVYRVILDNIVTWRFLEENDEIVPVKGHKDYTDIFRETAIWLLTNPLTEYENRDVLQHAIAHGAEQILWHIINTKSIFRQEKDNNDEVYDVTNFVWETFVKQRKKDAVDGKSIRVVQRDSPKRTIDINYTIHGGYKRVPSDGTAELSDVTADDKLEDPRREELNSPTSLPDQRSSELYSQTHDSTPTIDLGVIGNVRQLSGYPSRSAGRDFNEINRQSKPYLTYLLMHFDQWKDSDILSKQPFSALTMPYFNFAQRFYLFLGLLQLTYMIAYSWYYIPESCSLSTMFNITSPRCNTSGANSGLQEVHENDTLMSDVAAAQERSHPGILWLIWPIILMMYSLLMFGFSMEYERLRAKLHLKEKIVTDIDICLAFPMKLLRATYQPLPFKLFCFAVPVWFYSYRFSESYIFYIDVTALVLLFGWIANLHFFGAVSKSFSLSVLVVQEIVVKDLGIFMVFFGFTVVGFSFAMHTLRLSTCTDELFHVDETFYLVLSSAFGIGDFFEETVTNPHCKGKGTRHLFEAMYFGYVCTTMIILLNVLIAMMNQRYEIAKCRVSNMWKFQILSTVVAMEKHPVFATVLNSKIFGLFRQEDSLVGSVACKFCCWFQSIDRSKIKKKYHRYRLYITSPVYAKIPGFKDT